MFIPHHYQYNPEFFNWTAIAAIVSAIAGGISLWMANSIRRQTNYLEYSSRPTAYLLLLRSRMYVKNTSNFLIKFYFRMSLGTKILEDAYWRDPLYIYPGTGYMRFPDAFNAGNLPTGQIKIEYRVAPSHIGDAKLYQDIQVVDWTYDKDTRKWTGPNGMPEEGIIAFLPPTESI